MAKRQPIPAPDQFESLAATAAAMLDDLCARLVMAGDANASGQANVGRQAVRLLWTEIGRLRAEVEALKPKEPEQNP